MMTNKQDIPFIAGSLLSHHLKNPLGCLHWFIKPFTLCQERRNSVVITCTQLCKCWPLKAHWLDYNHSSHGAISYMDVSLTVGSEYKTAAGNIRSCVFSGTLLSQTVMQVSF